VEKGQTMLYESPEVELIGTASELIESQVFNGLDGGPTGFDRLPVHVALEEE
jgi:hypothetical protein